MKFAVSSDEVSTIICEFPKDSLEQTILETATQQAITGPAHTTELPIRIPMLSVDSPSAQTHTIIVVITNSLLLPEAQSVIHRKRHLHIGICVETRSLSLNLLVEYNHQVLATQFFVRGRYLY